MKQKTCSETLPFRFDVFLIKENNASKNDMQCYIVILLGITRTISDFSSGHLSRRYADKTRCVGFLKIQNRKV